MKALLGTVFIILLVIVMLLILYGLLTPDNIMDYFWEGVSKTLDKMSGIMLNGSVGG